MNWRILWLLVEVTVIVNSISNLDQWWKQTGRSVGHIINDCLTTTFDQQTNRPQLIRMVICLQERVRRTLIQVLNLDVIPLMNGVELVRYQTNDTRKLRMVINETSDQEWQTDFYKTLTDVFETHAIRVSLHESDTSDGSEARRRRKNQMMPLMMFGFVGLGMIIIPMGFQFLAVLGGKALLLAKLALILTSIQGLKKVATSSINYGLYHSAPSNPWYDRKAEEPYQTEEIYYNQIPEQIYEYNKRYSRP